jgi:dihydropteroate synthase
MFTLNCKGRLLVVDKPLVMGIINVTPDSFFSGSRHNAVDAVLKTAGQMLKDGADILDIGGQSTRPGSIKISSEEEMKRVIPCIEEINRSFPGAILSIDTYYANVAIKSIEAGASIINDVSAGSIDNEMIQAVSKLKVPYVLMHMQGIPQTMQENPHYADVTTDVLDFMIKKVDELNKNGIHDVIIDPGFGFGKTIQHNFQLLRQLQVFRMLNKPILLGISRKSTVFKTLGITAEDSLNGTTVLHTFGLINGASILRVHDVKEARQAINLFLAYSKA